MSWRRLFGVRKLCMVKKLGKLALQNNQLPAFLPLLSPVTESFVGLNLFYSLFLLYLFIIILFYKSTAQSYLNQTRNSQVDKRYKQHCCQLRFFKSTFCLCPWIFFFSFLIFQVASISPVRISNGHHVSLGSLGTWQLLMQSTSKTTLHD